MADIIWIHDEALRADHPVLSAAPPGSWAVFIWDNAYFDAMDMGFKRRVFIYEALADMPVDIIAGETVAVLTALAEGGVVHTASTPNAELIRRIAALSAKVKVNTVDDDALVQLAASPDLRRFFRYWNKAKKSALQPHGGMRDLFGGD